MKRYESALNQIYESRDRNGNHADEDWSQAETELMELEGSNSPLAEHGDYSVEIKLHHYRFL